MKKSFLLLLGTVLMSLTSLTKAAPYAIAAREVHLNGYDLFANSFNSSDPTRSTGGQYDPQKGGSDQAAVASAAGILNSINVGNVEIWGRLETEVPFSLAFGPASSIGSVAWHLSLQTGIEPGFHTTNLVWMFPDVAPPFIAGFVPVGGTYNGVFYNYILHTDDYRLSSLTLSGGQKMLVIGTSRLDVPGNASLSGNSQIVILPTASLRLYVAGTANLRGGGIVNQGVAGNFIYYGTGSNSELNLRISTPFVGGIYAPNATCTVTSGGGTVADMQGAVVVRSIVLGTDLDFHFDEALGQ
jgi:hypothetical protein